MTIRWAWPAALAALLALTFAQPAPTPTPQPNFFKHGNLPFWRNHRFTYNGAVSEEFSSQNGRPDPRRWIVHDPHSGVGPWDGRQPGLCHVKNVWINGWTPRKLNGLQIQANAWARGTDEYYNLFETSRPRRNESFEWYGYSTYTTGMISSKKAVKYGYYEVRAQTMRTQLVNAWWFSSRVDGVWSEIDVFENSHVTKIESKWNVEMTVRSVPNAHVYNRPTARIDPAHLISARPKDYVHWEPIANKPLTYGLLWTRDVITWFINGKPYVTIPNEHWHYPIFIRFDVETNFAWHGILPNVKKLNRNPQHYQVEYFRSFSLEYTGPPGLNKWSPSARMVDTEVVQMQDEMIGTSGSIAGNLRGVPPSVRTAQLENDGYLDGRMEDADELDEMRAEYYTSRVRDVVAETFDKVNRMPWDTYDPMCLIRAPYKGEHFGEMIKPPNGKTWDEVIAQFSKKLPEPKTWDNLLKNMYSWLMGLFGGK